MARKSSGRQKKRVEFRRNRGARARTGDWTREFARAADDVTDAERSESVRPKGELSRKRTVVVGGDDLPVAAAGEQRSGTVVAVHGLVCRVADGQGGRWDCTVRRVLRTRLIEQRSAVTVGDRVWFAPAHGERDRSGVIERVEPRRTVLARRVRTGHDARAGRGGRQHLLVANADQLLIVASVAQPALKPHLVDRYLVAALKGGLRPIICFNKIDLLEETGAAGGEAEASGALRLPEGSEFAALGFCVRCVSATTGVGVAEVAADLAGHITVVAGQSGVGKSSLLNAIEPGLHLAVGEVSDENEKGRHTTSHAELYRLANGGFVVDTPGVRQFDLWDVNPGELEAYFVEFLPYIQQCRFRDCTHRDEDGCAVRAGVAAGRIGQRRYESYAKMFAEV